MPAKIPFFPPSESLQQKHLESCSPQRITAQLYVFALLIAIGLLRHYLFPSLKRSSHSSPSGTFGSLTALTEPGAKDETLGEIDSLFIYPIKSCSGVRVQSAELTEQGFELDRRWMIIRCKTGGWDKISLCEEARLTLIQLEIDETHNILRLSLNEEGRKQQSRREMLEGTETILRPTAEELKGWKQVPKMEIYRDYADGRIVLLPHSQRNKGKMEPSEWISSFLGYSVLLIHFDTTSNTARNAFPIFKPPSDPHQWSCHDKEELHRKKRNRISR